MTEETLIRIVGPRGTDEVNFGGKSYPIQPCDGFLIPPSGLEPLLKTGGFIVKARKQIEIVVDIVRLVATLKPGRMRDLIRGAMADYFPDAPESNPVAPTLGRVG
jgi:hypothetical protein